MKRIYFLLAFFILFSSFQFCSTIQKQPGSIAKQVELVRDLGNKLPEEDRPRYNKFLDNIVDEEVKQDKTIEVTRKESEKASKIAINASQDAGKWKGIRDTFFAILFVVFLLIIGYVIFKLGIVKIPLLN